MAITAEPDQQDLKRIERNIQRMYRNTTASMHKVLRNYARDWVRLAIKETPIVAKHVTLRKVLDKAGKQVYRDGKPVWRRIKRSDKFSPIGRGFARAGWFQALSGLGVQMRSYKHPKGKSKAPEYGHYTNNLRPGSSKPSYEATNAVPYIGKLDRRTNFSKRVFDALNEKWEKKNAELQKKNIMFWGRR